MVNDIFVWEYAFIITKEAFKKQRQKELDVEDEYTKWNKLEDSKPASKVLIGKP